MQAVRPLLPMSQLRALREVEIWHEACASDENTLSGLHLCSSEMPHIAERK